MTETITGPSKSNLEILDFVTLIFNGDGNIVFWVRDREY